MRPKNQLYFYGYRGLVMTAVVRDFTANTPFYNWDIRGLLASSLNPTTNAFKKKDMKNSYNISFFIFTCKQDFLKSVKC